MYIVDLVFIKYPRNIFNNHLSEFFLRNFRIRRYKVNDFRELLEFIRLAYYYNVWVSRILENNRVIVDDFPGEY